jgi:hypothetical protein
VQEEEKRSSRRQRRLQEDEEQEKEERTGRRNRRKRRGQELGRGTFLSFKASTSDTHHMHHRNVDEGCGGRLCEH